MSRDTIARHVMLPELLVWFYFFTTRISLRHAMRPWAAELESGSVTVKPILLDCLSFVKIDYPTMTPLLQTSRQSDWDLTAGPNVSRLLRINLCRAVHAYVRRA